MSRVMRSRRRVFEAGVRLVDTMIGLLRYYDHDHALSSMRSNSMKLKNEQQKEQEIAVVTKRLAGHAFEDEK